jgi:hypothetical protein
VNGSVKRPYEEDPSSAKRARPEGSSLSNLLKKVGSSASSPTESTSESKRLKMQERVVAANIKSEELKGSIGEYKRISLCLSTDFCNLTA